MDFKKNDFDFYDEIIGNYESLVPNQTDGLIVFYLYQQVQFDELKDEFTHENVIAAIDQVGRDLGKETASNHNPLVRKLRKFFLRKTKKGYSLKEYAKNFCALVESELSSRFNPSQLEIKFHALVQSLKTNLDSINNFQTWYWDFFEKNKHDIKKQIDILHDKLEAAINKLNAHYNSDDIGFVARLKEMDLIIKEIQNDTNQLTKAFDAKEDIQELLNDVKNNPESFAFDNDDFFFLRMEVSAFLESCQHSLTEISNTVDSIIPQMDRLFGSLEHREFDRKLERFLLHLFNQSELQKSNTRDQEIKLPNFLTLFDIGIKRSRLTYCVDYKYFKGISDEPLTIDYDPDEEEINYRLNWNKILVNQKASQYCTEVINQLREEKVVNLNSHFDIVLGKENLDVALKSIFLVLNEFSNTNNLSSINSFGKKG